MKSYTIECMYDYSNSGMIPDQEVVTTPEEYFEDPRYYGAELSEEVVRCSREAIYFTNGSRYHRSLGWKHPRRSASIRRRIMRSKH